MGPKAPKQPIIVLRGIFPVFSTSSSPRIIKEIISFSFYRVSQTPGDLSHDLFSDYLGAEYLGHDYGKCDSIFNCRISLIDFFSILG